MIFALCDAYSRGCVTPPPTLPPTTPATPTLPVTGFTGGDLTTVILIAVLFILLGTALVVAYRNSHQ